MPRFLARLKQRRSRSAYIYPVLIHAVSDNKQLAIGSVSQGVLVKGVCLVFRHFAQVWPLSGILNTYIRLSYAVPVIMCGAVLALGRICSHLEKLVSHIFSDQNSSNPLKMWIKLKNGHLFSCAESPMICIIASNILIVRSLCLLIIITKSIG